MDAVLADALGLQDVRLQHVVGGEGYLADYLSYAADLTDAPAEYHIATSFVTLATACGNRLYFSQWGSRIHLNLWVVLISPSGWFRKSTAQSIGRRVLEDAGLSDSLLPSQFSREGFLDAVAEQPAGLLHYGEFGSFLALMQRDFNTGLKEDLTELYDSPALYQRKLRSGIAAKIAYPAISLQAATVSEWLSSRIRAGDVRGGFLSRFLFVVATQKTRWMGLSHSTNAAKKNPLVKHLAHLATLRGELDLEPIREAYETWQRDVLEASDPPPDLMGFYSRLSTVALKLAGLIELAAPSSSLTISLPSWQKAVGLVDYLRQQIDGTVEEHMTSDPWQVKRAGVLSKITRTSGILHSDLLKAVKMPERMLKEIIATLQSERSIEAQSTPSGPKGGRPGLRYYPRGKPS